jgi:GNAT superfamily N-acetyltransferase
MDAKLKELLETMPLQSLPVIGFFQNYPLEKVFREGDFLLMCGTSDYQWAYLCGDNPEELFEVLEQFNFATPYFANVEDWMLPAITHMHRIDWKLTTHRYYLLDDKFIEPPAQTFQRLEPGMARHIYELSAYKDYTSEGYIRDRLDKDISIGLWQDGELVGWGLTHDDASLGFLNVLPQWQAKGLGEAILRALILKKREMDLPVFVNIEPHNIQSINLIKKLGFSFDRQVSWLKLI